MVAAPAETQVPGGGEGLQILNTQLVNEIGQLRSELAFSIERNANMLRLVNDKREAVRAATLKVMERLAVKVDENCLKTKEVEGLKVLFEESFKEKGEALLKFNKLNVKFRFLETESEYLKLKLKEKEAMIKELSQELELIQHQENVRRTWTWLIPLTTVIVVAGTLVYASR